MASPAMAPVNPVPTIDQRAVATARVRIGAKWFYWIGGLSLVNSLAAILGGNFHFVIGLGMTSIVDELAKQTGGAGTMLDIVINSFIAGVFFLFGYFGCKVQKWAFFCGNGSLRSGRAPGASGQRFSQLGVSRIRTLRNLSGFRIPEPG